jgi:hypothetical protein
VSWELHPAGSRAPDVRVGDVLLTHSAFWTGRMIRFGQGLRWRGARRPFARWNHAALVTGDGTIGGEPTIAEALGHGVVRNDLGKYDGTEYALVRTGCQPADQLQVQRFAHAVVESRTRYGYLEILSLGLTLAIPLPVQFGSPGTMICSAFAAEALCRAGEVFAVTPEYAMPADLAEHFGVAAP